MVRKRSKSSSDDLTHDDVQPMTFIENETTLVWRFPLHISQSSIGGKTKLSNACTLIALKIAELIHVHDIDMPTPIQQKHRVSGRFEGGAELLQKGRHLEDLEVTVHKGIEKCPSRVISCLVNGIVDGNEAYHTDAGKDSKRVYNLPDAIKACDMSFAEVDFKLSTGSIRSSLPKLIRIAVQCPLFRTKRRLAFIMIGCIRTVLIVFDRDRNSLTLFDTHMHMWNDGEQKDNSKHGALIGTCSYSDLFTFADWVQNCVFPDFKNSENFEISLVQLSEAGNQKAAKTCDTHCKPFEIPTKFPIFQSPRALENKENYPVLRSILSKPPLITKIGLKRRFDSRDGAESGCSGRGVKNFK